MTGHDATDNTDDGTDTGNAGTTSEGSANAGDR